MSDWSFLTNHARVLMRIARHPDSRLVDVAAHVGVTERTVCAIVKDLSNAGYVVKERDGRRNRYHIEEDLPVHDSIMRERTIGELLDLLGDARGR